MSGTRHTRKAPRARSCQRREGKPKYGFRTRQAAEAERRSRIRQGAWEGSVTVYRCRHCGMHHVGHQMATKHDARSRR